MTALQQRRAPEESANPYRTGLFAPVASERTLLDLPIHGELPRDLAGAFLRNGPNPRFAPLGKYHWFDGDAMIHGMFFEDGRATYRNRYVQTKDFLEEERAGKSLWRGIREPFDPASESPNKNTANTDLVFHAGRLLAMYWQGAEAYEVSLPELQTRGVCDFEGTFRGRMSAHPKVDPRTGELVFMDYNVFAEPYLSYGVADAHGCVRHFEPISVEGPRFFHDLAITENYSILLDLPLVWHMGRMSAGRRLAYFDANRPARFGVLPRYGKDADVRWFEDDACYILHVINAYEDGEEIVLLAGRMEDPIPGRRYDPTRGPLLHFLQVQPFLYEWRFHMRTGAVVRRQLDDRPFEFPRMNDAFLGSASRFAYCPLLAPEREVLFEGFSCYDARTGQSTARTYGPDLVGGEVVFLPKSGAGDGAVAEEGERDGYLGTFVHDRRNATAEFWVLDAQAPDREPLARIEIPGGVPLGFHATFAPLSEASGTSAGPGGSV